MNDKHNSLSVEGGKEIRKGCFYGYSCIRCVTTWGAVLAVNRIRENTVWVADPDSIDAGEEIGKEEVQTMWKISLYKDFSHPQYSPKEWAKIHSIF